MADEAVGCVEHVEKEIGQAREEERERIKKEVAIMKEPSPSANDHAEYNRGMREGVTLLRQHIVDLLKNQK